MILFHGVLTDDAFVSLLFFISRTYSTNPMYSSILQVICFRNSVRVTLLRTTDPSPYTRPAKHHRRSAVLLKNEPLTKYSTHACFGIQELSAEIPTINLNFVGSARSPVVSVCVCVNVYRVGLFVCTRIYPLHLYRPPLYNKCQSYTNRSTICQSSGPGIVNHSSNQRLLLTSEHSHARLIALTLIRAGLIHQGGAGTGTGGVLECDRAMGSENFDRRARIGGMDGKKKGSIDREHKI